MMIMHDPYGGSSGERIEPEYLLLMLDVLLTVSKIPIHVLSLILLILF